MRVHLKELIPLYGVLHNLHFCLPMRIGVVKSLNESEIVSAMSFSVTESEARVTLTGK